MTIISSSANPQFKALRLLAESGRERRRQAVILLDGPHLVQSYVGRYGAPELIAVRADVVERPEIADLISLCSGARILVFSVALFDRLAPVEHSVGILAVGKLPAFAECASIAECSVLLDGVQDPGNVGAIIRTAAAAGVGQMLLSVGCADPWAPRTLRAGMGAQFTLPIRTGADLTAALESFDGTLIATVARGGKPPQAFDLTGPTAFLFGAEGAGLSEGLRARCAALVTIPMAPGIESLNVGAAAAIVLFERVRQLGFGFGQ